jgi:hypothetical protein
LPSSFRRAAASTHGGCNERVDTRGVLDLDRPVREYLSGTYRRLYSVRIGTEDYLLPAASVSALHSALRKAGDRPLSDLATQGLLLALDPRPQRKPTDLIFPRAAERARSVEKGLVN